MEKLKNIFKKKSLIEYVIYSIIIILVVLLDQITKLLATKYLSKMVTMPIIEGVIHFTYHTNDGIAFGMLGGARWLFMPVSIIAILAVGVYLFGGLAENRLYAVASAFIIGGGIGNMIDRTAFEYVVDFIDFRLIDFAIFNVADSFVCIGAGLLVLALVLDIINESKKSKENVTKSEDNNDTVS